MSKWPLFLLFDFGITLISQCLISIHPLGISLMAQTVKNLPEMHYTRVRSLDQEDPLEKEMVTPSGILAWRIPWTEEPGGLYCMQSQSQPQWRTNTLTFYPPTHQLFAVTYSCLFYWVLFYSHRFFGFYQFLNFFPPWLFSPLSSFLYLQEETVNMIVKHKEFSFSCSLFSFSEEALSTSSLPSFIRHQNGVFPNFMNSLLIGF